MKEFLIVIPVYNEADVVARVATLTKKIASSWAEILLVNDGSKDLTKEALDELKLVHPELLVYHKEINSGYGSSLVYGFKFGIENNFKYVITMDCDLQHQPKDLLRFKNYNQEVDIVSGSRYTQDSKSIGIIPPQDRVEINKRITRKMNKKYNWNLTDSFCGYKRYKTSSLVSDFEEFGYAFPMEFWTYAFKKNLRIEELSVDKIYITDDRSFGEDLDKKRKRFKYYLEAWRKAENKYSILV
jgi:dolichol-phosphate mannosyltransferase